jgi:hypothetical protein
LEEIPPALAIGARILVLLIVGGIVGAADGMLQAFGGAAARRGAVAGAGGWAVGATVLYGSLAPSFVGGGPIPLEWTLRGAAPPGEGMVYSGLTAVAGFAMGLTLSVVQTRAQDGIPWRRRGWILLGSLGAALAWSVVPVAFRFH